jgi:hypothetical protein
MASVNDLAVTEMNRSAVGVKGLQEQRGEQRGIRYFEQSYSEFESEEGVVTQGAHTAVEKVDSNKSNKATRPSVGNIHAKKMEPQ